MVTPSGVAAYLAGALDAIRARACAFAIPQPTSGSLDYGKVNVTLLQVPVLEVAGAGACDPADVGWYYDDPASPAKIVLCDASCSAGKGKADVVLGCKTEIAK